jgi:hypothetical protein
MSSTSETLRMRDLVDFPASGHTDLRVNRASRSRDKIDGRIRLASAVYYAVLVASLVLLGTAVVRASEFDLDGAFTFAVIGAVGAVWAFSRRFAANGALNPATIHRRAKSR